MKNPPGVEVAEDEVDGAVASAETSSCGFSGVEVGVWASTSSSEFLSVSSGSGSDSSDAAEGVGAPAYCSHSDTWAFPHHQAALRGWSPRARAPPALDRWDCPTPGVGLGAEEVRERVLL